MLHPLALDRRFADGLTCHVAALSPVAACKGTDAVTKDDVTATHWTLSGGTLLATPIRVAGSGGGWLLGAASTAASGVPVRAATGTAERASRLAEARLHALHALFAWVDSQPEVPFVPLEAMDRGNLY
jgi:hypothetical protein